MNEPELRYRDCPSASAGVVIDASPAAVWAIITDINLPARFSSEFLGAEWIDGATGPTVGARFVGRNHHEAIGTWETTCTVTELDEPHTFAYVVGDPEDPSATWSFTLTDEASGTRLTQGMQMGPARSGINIAIDAMPEKESKILRRRLDEHRANMASTLAGIKEIAES